MRTKALYVFTGMMAASTIALVPTRHPPAPAPSTGDIRIVDGAMPDPDPDPDPAPGARNEPARAMPTGDREVPPNAALAALHARWRAEPRDPAWARTGEANLAGLYGSLLPGSGPARIACRTTICKVTGPLEGGRSSSLALSLQSRDVADRLAGMRLVPSSSVIGAVTNGGASPANGYTAYYTRGGGVR